MSKGETFSTVSSRKCSLLERDIEKAELASSSSWSSTIIESSANVNSTIVQIEDRDVIDSRLEQKHSALCAFTCFPLHKAFTFPRPVAYLRAYYKNKASEKEQTQALYSNLITQRPSIEGYPPGWPQLAAFLHSEDNFAIFRRFGLTHCRVLVQLQGEIQLLEQQLSELDKEDFKVGPERSWRLQMADIEDNRAPCHAAQKNLLQKLQEKLFVYDQLLLNDQKLRELGQAKKNDHLSVYHWICREKPLGAGQYNFIYHATDFVPLSKTDQFEYSILNSFFKRLFHSRKNSRGIIDHYSSHRVSSLAKLISVLLAVAILIIPIFILLWIPETRAWISATVLISVFFFSAFMSLFTEARVQEVLVGTAAYCAVLATFLGNTQGGRG